jgi:hypothetical protein
VQPIKVEEFTAKASLILNGKRRELVGYGTIDELTGFVEGHYRHDVPANDVDPYIFQTVLVTGYPSVCRDDGSGNPFQGADYSYRREIDFGPNGWITYDAHCKIIQRRQKLCLESDFAVIGEVRFPALSGALPLTEEWRPLESGEIESSFEINWPVAGGADFVCGQAKTTYRPSRASQCRIRRRREIVFRHAHAQNQSLEIIQESWLSKDTAR